ncbi:receptor activity-modifying protein 2 [Alosa sapidissima]|uniref:receptor activity-modifying protein 2 n=1 Tax=Alosa sapidissima TaxID=34773 RepID=UPI001C093044|nr:receptor activity-modifying protein 2 [Alosa sapidissima]
MGYSHLLHQRFQVTAQSKELSCRRRVSLSLSHMRSELAEERQRRADTMRTSAWVPAPSPLVWVIYTSLLLGNIRALVNESKNMGDRKDPESTKQIWTETVRPSSPVPTHETHKPNTNGMVNSDRTTYDCGNKTTHCREYYCSVCEEFGLARSECYKALHDHVCYHPFISAMNQFNNTNLCQWHMVQEPYNTFTECTEEIADCLLIPWPNPDVEKVFVDIHTTFFQDCAVEELRDPPPSIVFALVMTPICLIPAMVILVVLKTKNGDGRS